MRSHRAPHNAFTLVELLVVIAIIGILVSLLLPAVNAARDATRKLQCASNMRQLGLAVIQYENTYKHLPVAGIVGEPTRELCSFNDDCFNPNSGKQFSWIVLVLPFMEEQSLFDDFDFRKTVFEQQRLPMSQTIATLLCPSDQARGQVLQDAQWTFDVPFAKGNFAGYASPVHVGHAEFVPGVLGGFTPGDTEGQPMRRITDGTSKTILVTEVRTRDLPSDQRGAWALPWTASTVLGLDAHHDAARCGGMGFMSDMSLIDPYCPRLGPYYTSVAQLPNRPYVPAGGQADTIYKCENALEARALGMPCRSSAWLSAPPRSLHVEGVNAFMLDGRVSFITDEVDLATMAYLISINDGKSVDSAERF